MSARALWKLLRLLATTMAQTLYLSVAVRFVRPERRDAYRACRQQRGCRRLCRILGLSVRVEGTMPEGGAMLAVSNHFGIVDPLILASQMPVAIVGKAELRSWPLIGWVTHTMGVIFVERGRPTRTGAFVAAVDRVMHHGVRVLVFPEGGTSPQLRPRAFKTGAFEAVAGMPDGAVLPLYLHVEAVDGVPFPAADRARMVWADTAEPFTAHGRQLLDLREVAVVVRIGTRVPTAEADRKALARQAHAQVVALAPPGGAADD